MTLQLFGKMSSLICNDYKRMVGKPETSSTYKKSLKIMAELAANKNQEMYNDYIRKNEPSPYVGKDPFTGQKPTPVTLPNNTLRPTHYGGPDNPYEVFNVLEAWGLDKDFYLGNVIKYLARAGKKDAAKELEDLEKAEVYLKRRISELKK